MAAPKKHASIRRTVAFTIRLSPTEFAALKREAKELKLPVRKLARGRLGITE